MKLYQPVQLPFADKLASITNEYMSQFETSNIHIHHIPITDDFRQEINSYLKTKGISNLVNVLCFKRRNSVKSKENCHLDGNSEYVHKCSIVIPVSGCKGTVQYWFDGDYESRLMETEEAKSHYLKLKWNNVTLFQEVEIYEQPVLVRTDIPHNGYTPYNEYRVTVTIRFTDNEDFDYLCKALS